MLLRSDEMMCHGFLYNITVGFKQFKVKSQRNKPNLVSNYSIGSQQLNFEKKKKIHRAPFFYDVISANGRLPLCFRNTLYSWSFLRMCDTSFIPKFKVLMTMRWSKSRSENDLCLFRSNKGQGHIQNRFSSIGRKQIIFLIMYKNKKKLTLTVIDIVSKYC